jgi:hypothetical protein
MSSIWMNLDEVTRRPDLRLDMDLEPGDIQLCNNYTMSPIESGTCSVSGSSSRSPGR